MKKIFVLGLILLLAFFEASAIAASTKKVGEIKMGSAAYNKSVSFQPGQVLQFPDFAIQYVDEIDPEEGAEVTSTAGVRIRHLSVTDKNRQEQKIEIYHGQLPPKPVQFSVAAGKFTIYSYQSPKGENLFPDKILISKGPR